MINVYFESSTHAELAAQFDSDETYAICRPALIKQAREWRMVVTESVVERVNLKVMGEFKLDILYGKDAVDAQTDGKEYANLEHLADANGGDFKQHTFNTEAEREAYLQGVAEGEGWMGYEVIN